MTSQAIISARPTLRIDTQESQLATELLLSMAMTEQHGGMSSLELRFSNVASSTDGTAGSAFEDESLLRLGANIAVYGGDETQPQEIFRGIITAIECDFPNEDPSEIVVLAEDVFQQARMTRQTRIHTDVSISDLASDLAQRIGLTPVVTGYTDPIGTRVQLNESDLAFFRRILERYDGDFQVVGEELHVSPRADVQRGVVELEMNGTLRNARVLADLSHQATQVTVSGWDASLGQAVTATSTGANLGPGQGRLGSEILAPLFDRSEHVGHLAVTNQEEAQALADSAFDHRARRLVCVHGTAEGNPAIRVGSHVQLSGMSPRVDNTYYVVHACHRFDVIQSGYETDFEAQCAYWGNP